METSPRIPLATYRVQLHQGFGFQSTRAIVAYLDKLGITDLYASPFFRARAGSLHGYDVTDPCSLNPEIGTEADLDSLSDELRGHGMGLILDVVPNHMGILDRCSAWWWDVLENGPSSPYSRYFDIDWRPPKSDLADKVLLPFLGAQYGQVLESGELRLAYEDSGAFVVIYSDRTFPTDPCTWVDILQSVLEAASGETETESAEIVELESVITGLQHLPPRTERDPEGVRERQREKEIVKRRLADLVEESQVIRRSLETVVANLNGDKEDPRSFDALEEILAGQPYRLCHWRVAADEVNYRRFFDINDLAAIRVEDPEVFRAVHGLVFDLIQKSIVTGLRIDHPDGLFDPESYLDELQKGCLGAWGRLDPVRLPDRESVDPDALWYVVVEKILARGENLRPSWKVHGTTGYDFLNLLNGIFVDQGNAEILRDLYSRMTNAPRDPRNLVYESKKLILNVSLSSELHVLARRLDGISEQHRRSRDFTLITLHDALREVISCFPVYRTYVRPMAGEVRDEDRRVIQSAVRAARRRNPATSASVFDFIESLLLLNHPDGLSDEQIARREAFVMAFQQITGPVNAKGIEDTAFYRYYPLASLNEVGGELDRLGVSIEEFHRKNAERLSDHPYGMSATSTHDTKRGEDTRARLHVLSEILGEWEEAVHRWREMNASFRSTFDGQDTPDPNEEYLLYQTLVGTWPLDPLDESGWIGFVERIERYMEKALKEAKVHTSWVNPNPEHHEAICGFVRGVLLSEEGRAFRDDFARFQETTAFGGMLNSLAQSVLKVASPGVPDLYQGTELWSLTLVDPDNRGAVDFELRSRWLDEIARRDTEDLPGLLAELGESWRDGRIKLYTTWKSLGQRKELEAVFRRGGYMPLRATGPRAENVCAFARHLGPQWVVIVAARWLVKALEEQRLPLPEAFWTETSLSLPAEAPETWQNVLSGATLRAERARPGRGLSAASLLGGLPVAILKGVSGT